MSRRKRQSEQFDVADFLRESDDDLKSALHSLLRLPAPAISESETIKSGPGIKLVPGPDLTSLATGVPINSIPGPKLGPGIELTFGAKLIPGINLIPGPDLPSNTPQPKKRHFPIREMKLAQDAHTRAEQQVYELLWQNAKSVDDVSRILTIGFGAMARMVRLSESNARINVRNLIAKLALEETGGYDCERSVGRSYRVFNYSEILKKRREAGLAWYTRRTLAVLFVDPATGQPLAIPARISRVVNSGPGPNLRPPPGINLGPPYREEEYREEEVREASSSGDSFVFAAFSQYGQIDDDVLTRLRAEAERACPDVTDAELIHFIHSKGSLVRKKNSAISNPIGFLLAAVPKCFVGDAFQLFRKTQAEARAREAAELAQRQTELDGWRKEQEAVLADPQASAEDRQWARKILYPDQTP